MIVQRADMLAQIKVAKQRGKPVAVGGPYPTSLPEEPEAAGADYLVLDEGEITLPLWVEALAQGESQGTFRANGERPDVTQTPIPRFDLLEMRAYYAMSVQFSRGCPFQCEFCDIIVLYGRKPRTKTPAQFLAELDRLYELGWRAAINIVDDNLIGNKRNVKRLLTELKPWMAERHYPFWFQTEASVDLAQDQELMEMMVDCNVNLVFLGIETPDTESLNLTKKFQNLRHPLEEAVDTITRTGIRVMAGFIIGFDGEKSGAGERVRQFVETTAIPTAQLGMLQALPNTALWHRLDQENRLINAKAGANPTSLMNFIPTRPLEEIVQEYLEVFGQLYDPLTYLNRTYRYCRKLGAPRHKGKYKLEGVTIWTLIRLVLLMVWKQGVVRKTRWRFWWNLGQMYRHNPKVVVPYLATCLGIEHYVYYRQIVQNQIKEQFVQSSPQELPPQEGLSPSIMEQQIEALTR
jgi:radical SAM superfamily enzyme YgiQ (UPF0313 family)